MTRLRIRACAGAWLVAVLGAAPAQAGSGWVNVVISSASTWQENGGEYVLVIDRVINPENCTQNIAELRWHSSSANSKSQFAVVLTAVASSRPLIVYVYGCTPSGYPQLWGSRLAG